MSATMLDVTAVRARFTALQRRLAFFDGPGGTQCPDEVIDAIAAYLRHDNANVGAPYETSRRTTALVEARIDVHVDIPTRPASDEVAALILKGERDCFVGASLTVKPDYRWTVNGEDLP